MDLTRSLIGRPVRCLRGCWGWLSNLLNGSKQGPHVYNLPCFQKYLSLLSVARPRKPRPWHNVGVTLNHHDLLEGGESLDTLKENKIDRGISRMEAFLKRKKRRLSPDEGLTASEQADEPTEVKLAILSSLHSDIDQEALLDILLAHDGNVDEASSALRHQSQPKRASGVIGSQASLKQFATFPSGRSPSPKKAKMLSKKGKTLFLYDPEDIEEHTPCSIIHNFLPADLANDLLSELLEESKTYEKITFKLFDTVVASPHTSSFYLGSIDASDQHKREYLYNGATLTVYSIPKSHALYSMIKRPDRLPRTFAKLRLSSTAPSPSSKQLSTLRLRAASQRATPTVVSCVTSPRRHGCRTPPSSTATTVPPSLWAGTQTSSHTWAREQ
jgi:hypothetical protein